MVVQLTGQANSPQNNASDLTLSSWIPQQTLLALSAPLVLTASLVPRLLVGVYM